MMPQRDDYSMSGYLSAPHPDNSTTKPAWGGLYTTRFCLFGQRDERNHNHQHSSQAPQNCTAGEFCSEVRLSVRAHSFTTRQVFMPKHNHQKNGNHNIQEGQRKDRYAAYHHSKGVQRNVKQCYQKNTSCGAVIQPGIKKGSRHRADKPGQKRILRDWIVFPEEKREMPYPPQNAHNKGGSRCRISFL